MTMRDEAHHNVIAGSMRDETRVIMFAVRAAQLLHESAEARGDELEAFEVTQFVLVAREHGRIIE